MDEALAAPYVLGTPEEVRIRGAMLGSIMGAAGGSIGGPAFMVPGAVAGGLIGGTSSGLFKKVGGYLKMKSKVRHIQNPNDKVSAYMAYYEDKLAATAEEAKAKLLGTYTDKNSMSANQLLALKAMGVGGLLGGGLTAANEFGRIYSGEDNQQRINPYRVARNAALGIGLGAAVPFGLNRLERVKSFLGSVTGSARNINEMSNRLNSHPMLSTQGLNNINDIMGRMGKRFYGVFSGPPKMAFSNYYNPYLDKTAGYEPTEGLETAGYVMGAGAGLEGIGKVISQPLAASLDRFGSGNMGANFLDAIKNKRSLFTESANKVLPGMGGIPEFSVKDLSELPFQFKRVIGASPAVALMPDVMGEAGKAQLRSLGVNGTAIYANANATKAPGIMAHEFGHIMDSRVAPKRLRYGNYGFAAAPLAALLGTGYALSRDSEEGRRNAMIGTSALAGGLTLPRLYSEYRATNLGNKLLKTMYPKANHFKPRLGNALALGTYAASTGLLAGMPWLASYVQRKINS